MTFATYAPRQPAHPTRTGAHRTINPRVLVYHTSEGAEGVNSAEALARFLQSPRTSSNLASYHYIVDTDDVIPVVPDDHVAYANAGANHDGLAICYPGTIRQSRTQWLDDVSRAYHEQVSRWTVDKCRQYGIPIVRLTDAELVHGGRGIVDHGAVSRVYKRSTHTDCGADFPWDHVLGRAVQLDTPTTPARPTRRLAEDDDMKALLMAHGRDEVFIFSGNAITWAWDQLTLSALYDIGAITGMDDARRVDWTTIQHYIDHAWTGGPVPSGYRQPG